MRILAVSDGRRGIENQALGLAEAVARQTDGPCEIAAHVLTPRPAFTALPPSLQLMSRKNYGLPPADLVIGCGRQAIAPLLGLKRLGRPDFTVYVQDPRIDPSRFDLVVAPDHDGLSGPFVETMIGSPNRITNDRIIAGTLEHAAQLATLPRPRAMIAIGGPSRTHDMDEVSVTAHLNAAHTLSERGHALLVTTSRRTPDAVQARWEGFAATHDHVWLHTPHSEGSNPYFAFLGGADLILVTEDSTNMLTESCTTGKPVYRLPMGGKPGKFATLYAELETACGLRPWTGTLSDAPAGKLRETDRVAAKVLERMSQPFTGLG